MSFRDPASRHPATCNDDILTSANAHVVISLYLLFPQEASFGEGKARDGNFDAETSAPEPGSAEEPTRRRRAPGWERAAHGEAAGEESPPSEAPWALRLHRAVRKKGGKKDYFGVGSDGSARMAPDLTSFSLAI